MTVEIHFLYFQCCQTQIVEQKSTVFGQLQLLVPATMSIGVLKNDDKIKKNIGSAEDIPDLANKIQVEDEEAFSLHPRKYCWGQAATEMGDNDMSDLHYVSLMTPMALFAIVSVFLSVYV